MHRTHRCVVEIFTYLRMGGERERICVYPFGGGESTIRVFEARHAQCTFDADRQQLFAVIESGFGDMMPFNKIVRDVLVTMKLHTARRSGESSKEASEEMSGKSPSRSPYTRVARWLQRANGASHASGGEDAAGPSPGARSPMGTVLGTLRSLPGGGKEEAGAG